MKTTTIRASVYLALFFLLVFGGIAVKRVWHHPELMMLFHLPAAVFLILGGIALKARRRSEYDAEIAAFRETEADRPE